MMCPVILVGPTPRPIGGMAHYVWRLALSLKGRSVSVLDLHPEAHKYDMPGVTRLCAPQNSFRKAGWFVRRLLEAPAGAILHLNFSNASRLGTIFFFLLACRQRLRIVITLHSGNQGAYFIGLNRLHQWIVKKSLRSMDVVFALNEDQRVFYRETIGCEESRLVSTRSFIPLTPAMVNQYGRGGGAARFSCRQEHLIVASGYPNRLYCYEIAVNYALTRSTRVHLVICLYGPVFDEGYHLWLSSIVSRHPDVVSVVRDLDIADFAAILQDASLYVRPALEDSYGLAVADALVLGTPVVASDVCVRHPAARLFHSADEVDFGRQVDFVLDDLPAERNRIAAIAERDFTADVDRVYSMQEAAPHEW